MLRTAFPLQQAQFDALATVWLTLGATSVTLWSANQLLGRWPANSLPRSPDLTAPIQIAGHTVGEVQVTGNRNGALEHQLAIGAALFSQWTTWESEVVRAQQVHTGFFPTHMPTVNGIELFAESRAALHVGGDYYDFLSHDNEELIFAIGDVCNKGVSAALFMAVLNKVLRTSIKVLATPLPKDILAYTNTDMYDEFSRASMFATGFIGQFTSTKRRLHFANAGHSPVIYCPVGKPAQLLTADNVPLGVLRQSTFIEQELRLDVGDLLIIATDGLVEMSDVAGELFGYKRLEQRVEQVREQPVPDIAQALFDTLDQFGNKRLLDDDQTLLVMRGVS